MNREAIFENGERIKYKEGKHGEEIEWIFAPGLGWENIPEEAIEEIKECNCMWDYYGKIIDDENYADPIAGWRNEFFIMKSNGKWKYRICPNIMEHEGHWKSVSLRKIKKKFSLFGGMKVYANEKNNWTNECDFIKRYNERKPLTQTQLLDKFMLKCETIFRWLLVAFNKKEIFWDNIRRDHARGELDCYEIRLEEIVNSFTEVTRKY
jgi:hypothetical protein